MFVRLDKRKMVVDLQCQSVSAGTVEGLINSALLDSFLGFSHIQLYTQATVCFRGSFKCYVTLYSENLISPPSHNANNVGRTIYLRNADITRTVHDHSIVLYNVWLGPIMLLPNFPTPPSIVTLFGLEIVTQINDCFRYLVYFLSTSFWQQDCGSVTVKHLWWLSLTVWYMMDEWCSWQMRFKMTRTCMKACHTGSARIADACW